MPLEGDRVPDIPERPQPPYYAVIFTSQKKESDAAGYQRTLARMLELARERPGYLGIESGHGDDGTGITVSYWRTREDIAAWKRDAEHLEAQAAGRRQWYVWYRTLIARVESDNTFGDLPAQT
jgi:heme-degrading monooxygenase HmoA